MLCGCSDGLLRMLWAFAAGKSPLGQLVFSMQIHVQFLGYPKLGGQGDGINIWLSICDLV